LLAPDGTKDFGDAGGETPSFSAPPPRPPALPREPRGPLAPPRRAGPLDTMATPPLPPRRGPTKPAFNGDGLDAGEAAYLQHESLESSYALDDEPMLPPSTGRSRAAPPPYPEEDYQPPRPPRSYRGLIQLVVAAVLVGVLAAVVSWQWPHITQMVAQLRSKPAPQTPQPPAAQPKLPDRVPQQQQQPAPGQPTTPGPNANQTPPAVAQRVVLYEEDPNDPQGKRFAGSAIWHTETVSPGAGLPPELAVRADIEVPERHMTVTWSLRRNTDKALPASHTIEIMFNLPADFPGGGISNVPGILMKQAEQARGTPLAGLAVKVTNGYFLIGLSAVDADRQRNLQLLKDQEWFDIPLVYSNGGRAILAVEKGPPGDKAFADAFAAWAK
jgi:hypothetical protein